MTYTTTQTSRDVEREADASRAQLSSTLEELRERLSPGQIIDELFQGTGANASKFVENLGTTMRDHPIPVLLIGAGIAMMFAGGASAAAASESGSSRRSSGRYRGSDYGESHYGPGRTGETGSRISETASSISESASDMADRAKSTMSSVADTASGVAGSVRETVSSARETASSMAEQARNKASSLTDSVTGMASRATDVTRDTTDYVTGMARSLGDQPVLLATIGMALGATIGAALPSTDVENRLMGETSDELKQRAQEMAGEQMEKAGAVASEVYQEVKAHAEEQGLTLEGAKGSGLGEKIASVVDHAAETVKQKTQGAVDEASKAAQSGTGESGQRDIGRTGMGAGEAGPRTEPVRPPMGEEGKASLGTSTSTEMGRTELKKPDQKPGPSRRV